MKNLLLASALSLVFLAQPAFADNPPIDAQASACLGKIDAQSQAFFQQQAADRGTFIKGNPNSIANHDKHFKAQLTMDMLKRQGKSTSGMPNPPPEDGTFLTFQQKQLSDKMTFLSNYYKQRQACLAL